MITVHVIAACPSRCSLPGADDGGGGGGGGGDDDGGRHNTK